MTASRPHTFVLSAALILGAVFTAPEARAGRRLPFLLVINTGSALYKVADLPPELAVDPRLQGWVVGYKCSHIGILWADVYCWDKELVLFKDDTFSDIPEELRISLVAQYPFSSCQRNVWNKHGFLVLIGLAVAGGLSSRGA